MRDVESSTLQRGENERVNNPYSNLPPVNVLPTWHPINVLKRILYMGLSLYGLNYFDAYNTLMTSPKISHEWFKVGLAASIGFLSVKAYVEIYSGKMKKQKVSYKTYPQSTHAALISLLIASVAFNASLWGAYGGLSMFIMLLVGTFLLHFCLLFPTYVQNELAIIILTWFLHEYK